VPVCIDKYVVAKHLLMLASNLAHLNIRMHDFFHVMFAI
jgi:hypothetical protein